MSFFRNNSALLWELCKLYGVQLFAIGTLGLLTIYRREISCNNIYHHSTDHHQQRQQQQHPSSRRCFKEGNTNMNRRRQQGVVGNPRIIWATAEVDRWILLEHCCYGLAFGPLISLVYFLCRIVILSVASLWGRMKGVLVRNLISRTNVDSTPSHSSSFRHAVAQEWYLCQSQGFRYPASSATLTAKTITGTGAMTLSGRDTTATGSLDPLPQYSNLCLQTMPRDVQFLLLSFLPVNDILAYGSTCRHFHSLVHCGSVAYPLWNTVTVRDFHDFIHWDVAQQRFYECTTRSTSRLSSNQPQKEKDPTNPILLFINSWHTQWASSLEHANNTINKNPDKNYNAKRKQQRQHHRYKMFPRGRKVHELYFTLYITCIPWSLALRNTTNCCYVGLYNAVYCITSFLPDHPGSVETLLMHAGTDASTIFEAVGHSTTARALADTMCAWKLKSLGGEEDTYYNSSCTTAMDVRMQWRQRRYQYNSLLPSSEQPPHQQAGYNNTNNIAATNSPEHYYYNDSSNTDTSSSLALPIVQSINRCLSEEEKIVRRMAEKLLHLEIIVGDSLHLFYDPFIQSWCCWYTSLTTDGDLEPIMMYIDDTLTSTID